MHFFWTASAKRIDGSAGVAIGVDDDLDHAGVALPLQRLRIGGFTAFLRLPERKTSCPFCVFREFPDVFRALAIQNSGFRIALRYAYSGMSAKGVKASNLVSLASDGVCGELLPGAQPRDSRMPCVF